MDCEVCAQTLEKYLNTLLAVRKVSVNFSTGKMQIVHDMTKEVQYGRFDKRRF